MTEVWKPVVGFEGLYEVSDQGRVRSLDRVIVQQNRWGSRNARRLRGKHLAQQLGTHGYLAVTLCCSDDGWPHCVHVLVMRAFGGERPLGEDVCHNNGNREDNRFANLRYDTRARNHADKAVHGTKLEGERHPQSKLTEEDVIEIRSLCARGASHTKLAPFFGVQRTTISKLARRETWRHVA